MDRRDPYGRNDADLCFDEEPLLDEKELDKDQGRATVAPSTGFSEAEQWVESPLHGSRGVQVDQRAQEARPTARLDRPSSQFEPPYPEQRQGSPSVAQRFIDAAKYVTRVFGDQWIDQAANEEQRVRQLTSENRSLKIEFKTQKGSLAKLADDNNRGTQRRRELEVQVRQLESEKLRLEDELIQATDHIGELNFVLRDDLVRRLEAALGVDSQLLKILRRLADTDRKLFLRVGYACLYSLPLRDADEGRSHLPSSINETITMSTRFLENIKDLQFTDRNTLLNLVALHLADLTPGFEFENQEGRPFRGQLHEVVDGAQGPDDERVTTMTSYLVKNRKTQKLHKRAVVSFKDHQS